jgi:predicted DNA-binding antitoxin AbrB/MazE fold protein
MSLAIPIKAVYENGLLRPLQALPFQDRQEVIITIATEDRLQGEDSVRLQAMHAQADAWLARQPEHVIRSSRSLSVERHTRLNRELDQLLSEVDAEMGDAAEVEIARLVDEAVRTTSRKR